MKPHLMIVEDDRNVREIMREALELEGYRVTAAENGRDALEKMDKDAKPALILLDMMMPVMTGREFLDHIESDDSLRTIPVIVISSVDHDGTSGIRRPFLKKPTDLDELIRVIRAQDAVGRCPKP